MPQEWYYSIYDISIHAPPRGATGCRRSGIIVYTIFQFTPLREGRRGRLRRFYFHDFISIHAPPRGATHTVRLIASCPFISIHAPPRGATLPKMNRGSYLFYFNSRPSARGDLWVRAVRGTAAISIHAPPRGATSLFFFVGMASADFNSRPSARGDSKENLLTMALEIISIHAPPRGATCGGRP